MDAESFWLRAKKIEATGCMEWQGARSGKYRMVYYNKRVMGAHRAAWLMTKGEIQEGMLVCHKCDNPPCVNPDHLFLGTYTDNNRDMTEKGRRVSPVGMRNRLCKDPTIVRGERNGYAKLTQAQVDTIKTRLGIGDRPSVLAAEYGVCVSTIHAIGRGSNWGARHGSMYRSIDRVVKAFGVSRTLREWHALHGISPKTIAARLANGWNEESAVSRPLSTKGRWAAAA